MVDSTIAGVSGRLDRLHLIERALRAGPIRLRTTPGLGATRPNPGASRAHSLQPPRHEPALVESTI